MSAVAITAATINDEHRKAQSCADTAVQHAIRCGELHAQKKGELPHGEFQKWVEASCEFSGRTARLYMQAADHNGKGLPFSSLTKLLASGTRKPAEPDVNPEMSATDVPPKVIRMPRAERAKEISALIADGHSIQQIAKHLKVEASRVYQICRIEQIASPTGHTKRQRISTGRVAREAVSALAGFAHSMDIVRESGMHISRDEAISML